MTSPELIFLHIPKAAGTSQHRSFRQYYGPENVFWIGEDCPGDVRRYPAKLVADRLLVGGHKPLSFYPSHFDPLFCAVLRDPVERAISLFSYYTQPGLARAEEGRIRRAAILERMKKNGMDPDSMLNSIRRCRSFRHEISNMQCRYISESSADFAKVRDSLERHDFVLGTIGTYDAFHRELGNLLEWPDEQPGALNRSKANYASAYLADEELVALVRELNEEDEKLLHYVTQQHAGLYINFRDRDARVERLSGLPLKPWMSRPSQADWEATARAFWPAREEKRLAWPLEQVVVSEPARLLYGAIPGPANTVVQRLMLGTSGVKH